MTALVACGVVYVCAMAGLVQLSPEAARSVLIVNVAIFFVGPLFYIHAKKHDGPRLAGIVAIGFGAKLVGSVFRYVVVFALYDGSGDATYYGQAGKNLAAGVSRGGFRVLYDKSLSGTDFIESLTGLIFAITGSTLFGGFVVFSCIGFAGLYLMYRAVRTALPAFDSARYALLIFLLPAMVFWPSSIGKEAWMILGIGAAVFGYANLITGRMIGLAWLAGGLLAAGTVRPHIAVALVTAIMVAEIFGGHGRGERRPRSPAVTAATILFAAVAAALALNSAASFFKVDRIDATAVDEILARTEDQTTEGGSSYQPVGLRSPVQLPVAAISLLFRPFPFEARNFQSLLAASENLVLLFLAVRFRRQIMAALRSIRGERFLLMAVTYSLVFIATFSSFGNFGLITRQRVQMLPFVLILLAAPLVSTRKEADGRSVATQPPLANDSLQGTTRSGEGVRPRPSVHRL